LWFLTPRQSNFRNNIKAPEDVLAGLANLIQPR